MVARFIYSAGWLATLARIGKLAMSLYRARRRDSQSATPQVAFGNCARRSMIFLVFIGLARS